jgi:hypothetical protein
MEKIFFVKLKFYKFRDLSSIDRRIICANNPTWERKAKLFRHKLASEEKLYEVFHNYYVTGGYCLTEIPIRSNANVLLVCNNGNHNQQYLPIKIRFYNDQNKFIHSVQIDTTHVRNMFLVPLPEGSKCLDYIINDEDWKLHHYSFKLNCDTCTFSDSD